MGRRRTFSTWAKISLVLGCVVLGASVVAGFYLGTRLRQNDSLTDWDRTTLITTRDLGIHAPVGEERWSSSRPLGADRYVEFHHGKLPPQELGLVQSWRKEFGSAVSAQLDFHAGVTAGHLAFAVAKAPGERLVDQPWLNIRADDAHHSMFFVGEEPAGHFVLVRRGRHVLFLNVNGYILSLDQLERMLEDRLDRMEQGPPGNG